MPLNALSSFMTSLGDVRSRLGRINCPTLIMHDERDRTIDAANAYEIYNGISSVNKELRMLHIQENVTSHHVLTTHRETRDKICQRVTDFFCRPGRDACVSGVGAMRVFEKATEALAGILGTPLAYPLYYFILTIAGGTVLLHHPASLVGRGDCLDRCCVHGHFGCMRDRAGGGGYWHTLHVFRAGRYTLPYPAWRIGGDDLRKPRFLPVASAGELGRPRGRGAKSSA